MFKKSFDPGFIVQSYTRYNYCAAGNNEKAHFWNLIIKYCCTSDIVHIYILCKKTELMPIGEKKKKKLLLKIPRLLNMLSYWQQAHYIHTIYTIEMMSQFLDVFCLHTFNATRPSLFRFGLLSEAERLVVVRHYVNSILSLLD